MTIASRPNCSTSRLLNRCFEKASYGRLESDYITSVILPCDDSKGMFICITWSFRCHHQMIAPPFYCELICKHSCANPAYIRRLDLAMDGPAVNDHKVFLSGFHACEIFRHSQCWITSYSYDWNRIAAESVVPCSAPSRYEARLVDVAWLAGGPVGVVKWETGTSLSLLSIPNRVMGVHTRPTGVLWKKGWNINIWHLAN